MCTPPTPEEMAKHVIEVERRKKVAKRFSRQRRDTIGGGFGMPRKHVASEWATNDYNVRDEKWIDADQMKKGMESPSRCYSDEMAKWASNFSTDEMRAEAVEMFCTSVADLVDDIAIHTLSSVVKDQKKRSAVFASIKKDHKLIMEFGGLKAGGHEYTMEFRKGAREAIKD
jgi:hypothetical protein